MRGMMGKMGERMNAEWRNEECRNGGQGRS